MGYDNQLFQFHKGTIRTECWNQEHQPPSHFNSIKVQLELPGTGFLRLPCIFQFHKGTIRTGFPLQPISERAISIP